MLICRQGPKTLAHDAPFGKVWHVSGDFGAFRKEYYIYDFGPRVGVVVLRDGTVLLVRQYRLLVDRLAWEIPGGGVESGEQPAAAAVRETREETGIDCRELEPLVEFYPGLDNVDNRTSIFLARRTETVFPFKPNPKEVVSIEWVPLADCLRMVFTGDILDALTVTGVLAAHVRLSMG
jgi:ADP-ribose pyrophosphatase